jgi:hypothetical protein
MKTVRGGIKYYLDTACQDLPSSANTVGERPGFPKTFSKINIVYRILHHTLIKHH